MEAGTAHLPLEFGLAVDSRLVSRQKLVRDLEALEVFRHVVEAKSIRDALDQVEERPFDTCVIGSFLSAETAVNFVREFRVHPNAAACALVSVRGDDTGMRLFDAGVHSVLHEPYTSADFSAAITEAVRVSSGIGLMLEEDGERIALCGLLSDVADNFSVLAQVIQERTRLGEALRRDSKASEAICLIVDQMMLRARGRNLLLREEHLYSAAIVDWFLARSRLSWQVAEERLRTRLPDDEALINLLSRTVTP